jgi:hypothetical protein
VIQVNTDNVDHRVDSIIAIYDPTTRTFEDAEIAAFTSSSITVKAALSKAVPGDAIVLPVRFGHILREPGFDDRRTGKMVTEIIFETEDNVDLAYADLAAVAADGWTVHPEDGYPIFDGCNVMGGTQRRKWEGKITRKDNQIGLPLVAQRYPVSDIVGDKATVDIVGLAEIRRWRSLLHFLRGSLRLAARLRFHAQRDHHHNQKRGPVQSVRLPITTYKRHADAPRQVAILC